MDAFPVELVFAFDFIHIPHRREGGPAGRPVCANQTQKTQK